MELADSCWVDISLSAFSENVRHAEETLAQNAKLMVAVKSDAYGHGGIEIATAAVAAGADSLAVLDIATGAQLRESLPNTPMLAWLLAPGNDFRRASEARLTLGVSHLWQLEKLAGEAGDLCTTVHLKIDTGLHRNGALASDWPELVARAAELEGLNIIQVEGVWSHLADTSIEEDTKSLERFHHAVAVARQAGLRPTVLHIAASAAARDVPESRLDMVRIGIVIYGVSPFDDRSATDLGFTPVMKVTARVTQVDSENSRVSLGMGYADGLFTIPAGTGWLRWGEHHLTIESVDTHHTVVSVPPGGSPPLGEAITLWGDPEGGSPLAEDWASWAGTIGDEVVSAISARVPRNYLTD
jgi:alanine racemase